MQKVTHPKRRKLWTVILLKQHLSSANVFPGCQSRPNARGRAAVLPNLGGSFYLSVHPLTQNDEIWRGDTWESVKPSIPRGAPASTIWGLPSIYAYTLRRRTTELSVIILMGRCEFFFWGGGSNAIAYCAMRSAVCNFCVSDSRVSCSSLLSK